LSQFSTESPFSGQIEGIHMKYNPPTERDMQLPSGTLMQMNENWLFENISEIVSEKELGDF
jgi:hypothetical protein